MTKTIQQSHPLTPIQPPVKCGQQPHDHKYLKLHTGIVIFIKTNHPSCVCVLTITPLYALIVYNLIIIVQVEVLML